MNRLALLLPIVSLAGCMTSSPKSFEPLAHPGHFVFEQDVMVANKVSSGLAQGRYDAVFQSGSHVYYLGPPKALIMPNGTRVNGGIALPQANATQGCYLFIQTGDDSAIVREQGMGLVVAELSKLEAGRIREFKDDPQCPGFLPQIHVVQD